jgi:3-methyl-2-oxobutanoate hydroxymethyltransferase
MLVGVKQCGGRAMSSTKLDAPVRRLTATDLSKLKGKTPIVCLTAYTAWTTRLLDPHADLLLVGDSLGMVIYGMPSTLSVSLDMMIAHGRAVVAASTRPMVLVDMPFGSYESNPVQAFENAARVMAETGASGVKLECSASMLETVEFLVARGIPVMAHIGLLPQSVNTLGGYRARGHDNGEAQSMMELAKSLENAGAFAILIEATRELIARQIHDSLRVLSIGIGASPACDGQILVTEDMLGLTGPKTAKFVRRSLCGGRPGTAVSGRREYLLMC